MEYFNKEILLLLLFNFLVFSFFYLPQRKHNTLYKSSIGEETSRNHRAYVKRSPRNNKNKYKNSAVYVRHEQIRIFFNKKLM